MEGLLGMYATSDEEEDDDQEEDKRQHNSPPSSSPPPRPPTSSSSLLRTQQLLATTSTGTIERPLPSSSCSSASGLPALDPGFFHVSAEHVYTTVLTNGQRRGLPSSSTNKKTKTSSSTSSTSVTGAEWVRSVPHFEGKWATHIYIRVPNTKEVVRLAQACIEKGRRRLRKVLVEGEGEGKRGREGGGLVVNDLTLEEEDDEEEDDDRSEEEEEKKRGEGGQHLTLSRTVYLRSHHIEPFVADLRKALSWARAFVLPFGGRGREGGREGGLLVNDEGTRSFLTVPVEGGGGEERLVRLVESVDEVLRRYRQPVYYKEPLFHLSVASMRGDVGEAWREGGGEDEEEEGREEEEEGAAVYVDRVECRIGQKLFGILLRED